MANVDQRRFDNQSSDFIGAREAARRLDVKLPTLYAYVSRGLIRSVPGPKGRPRRYAADDVARLVARRDARKGHGAVAAGALRWGEPVLDSAITEILPTGHAYRGHDAVALARSGRSFEAVAELLWTGELPEHDRPWSVAAARVPRAVLAALPPATTPIDRLCAAVPILAARDSDRYGGAELDRARGLILSLAGVAGIAGPARERGVAAQVAAAAGARSRAARSIDRALIALADHELNVSAFAARVAASAGADLYACVSAALAALSGPLHGGACDRVEALLDACADRDPRAELRARVRRGDAVPGFGHRLYPDGDPRAPVLLDEAARVAPRSRAVGLGRALVRGAAEPPTVDFALVVLCRALGLPAGTATALFALGRSAGWIAHAREQRAAGFMLRPRARFVGVAESSEHRKLA